MFINCTDAIFLPLKEDLILLPNFFLFSFMWCRWPVVTSLVVHSVIVFYLKKKVWFEIHLKPTLIQVLGTEFFIFMLFFFSSRAEFIFSALRNHLWKSKNFIMSVFSRSSDFSNCPLISFYKVCLDQNPVEICMLHLADTPLNIKYNSSLASPLSQHSRFSWFYLHGIL